MSNHHLSQFFICPVQVLLNASVAQPSSHTVGMSYDHILKNNTLLYSLMILKGLVKLLNHNEEASHQSLMCQCLRTTSN